MINVMKMLDDLLKEPLPEPWTFGVTQNGCVFFINDEEQITTWIHPNTGKPVLTGFKHDSSLPVGWEKGYTLEGEEYYVNHNDQSTTLSHPNEETIKSKPVDMQTPKLKRKKRRSSFTGSLSRPLFRRSSSKAKLQGSESNLQSPQVEKKRPSSASTRSRKGSISSGKMVVTRRDLNSTVAKRGWLYKQDSAGVGGIKIWRKRWFVLSDFCVFYYKDSAEDEVLGSVVLPSYDVTPVTAEDKISRKYAFKITHPGMRTYYISTESHSNMVEWIQLLQPICTLQKQGRSRSRKDEEAAAEHTSAEEFGFTTTPPHIIKSPPSNTESNHVTVASTKRIIDTSSVPSSPKQPTTGDKKASSPNGGQRLHSGASLRSSCTHSSVTSPTDHQRQNSEPPRNGNRRQRRPDDQPQQYSPNIVSTSQNHRTQSQGNKVHRNDSMTRLGYWVVQKQQRHSHRSPSSQTSDTATEMSSAYTAQRHAGPNISSRAPSSGKRYMPGGTYNDYMDQTDVASSIMSVPPMHRHHHVVTLPRPHSTQELKKPTGAERRIVPSKSVGHLNPDVILNTGHTQSENYLSPPPSAVTTDSARSPVDDVFLPKQPISYFRYDTTNKFKRTSSKNAVSSKNNYEIKQMDVHGKKGQLRAFAVSLKQNSPDVIPATVERLHANAADTGEIQLKLDHLNELDRSIQHLSTEIGNLQHDKSKLEDSIQRAKINFSFGDETELEEQLFGVKKQLIQSAKKLREMTRENEDFEKEVRKLKSNLLDELRRRIIEEKGEEKGEGTNSQRQLELDLDRVDLAMAGVNKNKLGLVNNMEMFKFDYKGKLPPANTPRNKTTVSGDLRSPRDVKRIALERRGLSSSVMRSSTSSCADGGNFYTLPGVKHASSVDSLTAASLARVRPTNASTSNTTQTLQRTKSATERLLYRSHANLTHQLLAQDPSEIKRIQREINQNRRMTLTTSGERQRGSTWVDTARMQVGIDVQMAIKQHHMPKVLQRAKRDMHRAEIEQRSNRRQRDVTSGFDIDRLEAEATTGEEQPVTTDDDDDVSGGCEPVSPHKEEDLEPDEVRFDLNLTHQLIAPDKVEIPDRLVEFVDEAPLSASQERAKRKKIRAIESMLARTGQPVCKPNVHLAAALATEAGTVARAVAYQAQTKHETPKLPTHEQHHHRRQPLQPSLV